MSKLVFASLILFFALNADYLRSQDTIAIALTDTINPFYQDSVNLNLLIAAENGDLSEVLEAIRLGAEINATTDEGVTALMYASQGNYLDIVKILLHNDADPDIKPKYGNSALITATKYNYVDVTDQLIQYGANINARDNYSLNPIMYSALYGYFIMTDMLIYYGADIHAKTDDSTNAIILASLNGKTEIVDLLIKNGADFNSKDINGFTALIAATQNGHYDVVKLLTDTLADPNASTIYGTTPLYYAANNGYTDILNLLLERGADPDKKILNDKKLTSLPSIYTYPFIRKSLKNYGVKMNYWPGFNSFSAGCGFNFNNKDILSGLITGINDHKYNLGIFIGYEMRYWAKRTLVEKSPYYYYQFWERRSTIYLSAEKRFKLLAGMKSESGLQLGAKLLYTFGSYRGSDISPDSKTKFTPQTGFYYSLKFFTTKLLYEYIDYGNYEVPPHRLNLQLLFDINLIRYKKYEKKVDWLD